MITLCLDNNYEEKWMKQKVKGMEKKRNARKTILFAQEGWREIIEMWDFLSNVSNYGWEIENLIKNYYSNFFNPFPTKFTFILLFK